MLWISAVIRLGRCLEALRHKIGHSLGLLTAVASGRSSARAARLHQSLLMCLKEADDSTALRAATQEARAARHAE